MLRETDISSHDGLSLTRYYNSGAAAAIGRMFGSGWRLAFESSVSTTGGSLRVIRPDGQIYYFTESNGLYQPDADVKDELVRLPATGTLIGWRYNDVARGTIESYNAQGYLTGVASAKGYWIKSSLSDATTPLAVAPAAGYLISVTDAFGRSLSFIYGSNKLLQSVTGPGYEQKYTYDSSGRLSIVTFPDAATKKYFYNEATFNSGVSLPFALTGIVDELGHRFANYWYDASGRAFQEQLLAGPNMPVSQYRITYDSLVGYNDTTGTIGTTGQSTMSNPLGATFVYQFAAVQGTARLTGTSQPGGAGCLPSTSTQAFDSNANLVRRDDFNGKRACYAYDASRNLRTVTLEGLPTSKTCPSDLSTYAPSTADPMHLERKTTTVWHPDWVLKTREAEPKKITTWVYNGQPDPIGGGTPNCAPSAPALPNGKPIAVVCRRYEQATSDTTGAQGVAAAGVGALRQWNFTYNQWGQVLTETSPRLSPTDTASHTTTYTYWTDTNFGDGVTGHTMGDLYSVKNPLGQVTKYTLYDKAGRLLSSTDPNGTVTTQTYWPRGWLRTQTITPSAGAAVKTTYDYWPTGLLRQVTLPDASKLSYTYDGAHRLTDVVDGAGNKVHYVLDNQGNRTSEQVSDASGRLASTIARVFDNLNRLQTVTGAAQ